MAVDREGKKLNVTIYWVVNLDIHNRLSSEVRTEKDSRYVYEQSLIKRIIPHTMS